MSWLLSKLAGYLWPAVLAGYVALGLWGGVEHFKYVHAVAATEDVKKAWALDKANATTLAIQASEQARAKETAWAHQLRSAQDDYAALQASHAKAIVAARNDVSKLRDQLASYASPSDPASDTIAASNQRAATLGQLLAAALQSDADHAADAEANADAVRTLLAAWPH